MLIWDFNVIVALGMILSLGFVVSLWVVYTLSSAGSQPERYVEFFRQCRFCSYLYLDFLKKVPGHCPRCGSYHQ